MSDDIVVSRLEGTRLIIETDGRVEEYDSQFLVAALLISVARGSGRIEPEESAKIIDLIEERYHLHGPETLELITCAMSELLERPELGTLLAELATTLSAADKEDIALMALKVVAADGQRKFSEMERFNRAMESVGISPDIIHRAFDRYFAETMPGLE